MPKLTKQGAKRYLAIAAIGITGYILGALMHSEILHYFADLLGIK